MASVLHMCLISSLNTQGIIASLQPQVEARGVLGTVVDFDGSGGALDLPQGWVLQDGYKYTCADCDQRSLEYTGALLQCRSHWAMITEDPVCDGGIDDVLEYLRQSPLDTFARFGPRATLVPPESGLARLLHSAPYKDPIRVLPELGELSYVHQRAVFGPCGDMIV